MLFSNHLKIFETVDKSLLKIYFRRFFFDSKFLIAFEKTFAKSERREFVKNLRAF